MFETIAVYFLAAFCALVSAMNGEKKYSGSDLSIDQWKVILLIAITWPVSLPILAWNEVTGRKTAKDK